MKGEGGAALVLPSGHLRDNPVLVPQAQETRGPLVSVLILEVAVSLGWGSGAEREGSQDQGPREQAGPGGSKDT